MVTTEYKIAYYEVFQILKHISNEEYEKLPRELVAMIKEVSTRVSADETNFVYNPELTLEEQGVSPIAKTIIAILYKNYWADEKTRKNIAKLQKVASEKMKSVKHSPENDFKNNIENKKIEVEDNKEEVSLSKESTIAIVPEDSFFKKIINKIKSFFDHEEVEIIDGTDVNEDLNKEEERVDVSLKNNCKRTRKKDRKSIRIHNKKRKADR